MTEKEIWDEAYKRIFKFYGDMPDLRIISRFYSEKQAFMQCTYIQNQYIIQMLFGMRRAIGRSSF